jgi:transposase-like protein
VSDLANPKVRTAQAVALKPKQDVNLVKLIERFGSEDKCQAYLEGLRWPEGVRCPRCGSAKISRIVKRAQFDCDSCRYQFSVRVDTAFEGSHLPLWKWFLATYLICEARKGVSANQLKRTLGVSYKTAWFLCHRIRWAMGEGETPKLTGTVEVDETYIGGKSRYPNPYANKTMVLGAIERNGRVVFRVEGRKQANREILHRFVADVVADDAEAIYTDSHYGYQGIGDENTRHESVSHSREEWVRGDVHTNSVENVWSLLDRSIMGSFHQISTKHIGAYLDEIAFRFNNRENPYLFRDTILKLIAAEPLTYAQLIEAGKG